MSSSVCGLTKPFDFHSIKLDDTDYASERANAHHINIEEHIKHRNFNDE